MSCLTPSDEGISDPPKSIGRPGSQKRHNDPQAHPPDLEVGKPAQESGAACGDMVAVQSFMGEDSLDRRNASRLCIRELPAIFRNLQHLSTRRLPRRCRTLHALAQVWRPLRL